MINKLQKGIGLNYPCPAKVGVYSKQFSVTIPPFNAGLAGGVMGSGTYRATIEMRKGNQLLACVKVRDLKINM